MHFKYMKYVLRHKWYVLLACFKFKVNIWQALTHDWNKFLPCEWIPYARYFYGKPMYEHWSEVPTGLKYQFPHCITVKDDWKVDFAIAWNHHQKLSPHHWQYWLITWDMGKTEPLQMPERYIREMLSDWAGAGKAITGKWEYKEWYLKNKMNMILHPGTIDILESLI